MKTLLSNFLLGLALTGTVAALSSTAHAHPLDTWHDRYTNNAVSGLSGVTYGGGLFVVVGYGVILTSPTGEQWTLHLPNLPNTNQTLNAVSYGNGMFVAVGNTGMLLSSPDGTNWTVRSCPGISFDYHGINYGNGRFVAAAGDKVAVSVDGTNWTAHSTGVTFSPWLVAFGNGLFLLGHTSGTNRGSNDGTNWFALPSGSPTGLYTIGFGNGKFVSIDTQNHVFTSTNGTNWTQVGSIGLLRPSQIAYGSGHYVTVGGGPIYFATNPGAWRQSTSGYLYVGSGVAYGRGTFVAVGAKRQIIQSDPVVWLEMVAPNAFKIFGPEGRALSIETADAIPTNSWNSVTNFTLIGSPTLWTDPVPPVSSQRFYRAVLP